MGLRCVGEAQLGGSRCSPCPPRPCGEDGARLRELPLGWGHQPHVQEQRVCRRGAAPWPQGCCCLAAGAVPPVAARAQQWCGTSARGCSRATGAHPRAIPGKAAVGQELAADLPNPAGPSAAPYLCSACGSVRPFGEGWFIAAGLPRRHPALRPRGNPPSTFQSVLGTTEPFPGRERCCQLYGLGGFQPFHLVSRICIKC